MPILDENKTHPLTGNYRGHMACHVENDTLLIWWYNLQWNFGEKLRLRCSGCAMRRRPGI
ncbi:MAG: type II toxin-antitoxin system YafQ family toxin [Muribaculaceae bacterium]|nr:type II toxin-antitoxin system YafQ family toxin [Muribaculaceae bacterium]